MARNTRDLIIAALQRDPMGWHNAAKIAQQTSLHYRTVHRNLKIMQEDGEVSSRFGPSSSREFKLKKAFPVSPVHSAMANPKKQIAVGELVTALQIFAAEHKIPLFMATGTYKNYGSSVGGIFAHACDVAFGVKPNPGEMIEYHRRLTAYAMELRKHLTGVETILNTPLIWDPDKAVELIEKANIPVDDLAELAAKAVQNHE